jgi:hypothetical protein
MFYRFHDKILKQGKVRHGYLLILQAGIAGVGSVLNPACRRVLRLVDPIDPFFQGHGLAAGQKNVV